MANWRANDGTVIHYTFHKSSRDGPCLLLLHGLLGSGHQWQPYVAQFIQEYNILLPDLRGHGRSGNQAVGLQAEVMLSDLVGLLDALELPELLIGGYDLGAYLGLTIYLNRPNRVKALVMHAAKIFWSEKSTAAMISQLDPDHIGVKAPDYAEHLAQLHGGVKWRPLVRQAADLTGQLSRESPGDRELGRVSCPLLVSVGDRDELVSLPEAHRLSRLVPHGSLLVVPGGGHAFPGAEQLLLGNAMRTFLAANRGRQI